MESYNKRLRTFSTVFPEDSNVDWCLYVIRVSVEVFLQSIASNFLTVQLHSRKMNPDEEDEGMERFEVDDRDIEYALNPAARRGLSKNQQLYGLYFEAKYGFNFFFL